MKKLVALLMAMAMLLTFVACGKADTPGQVSDDAPSSGNTDSSVESKE